MATGLTQHASQHGHSFFHAHDTQHGSPLEIFSSFAYGVSLVAVTAAALGAVAHLAHLINTSWQLF